MKTRQHQSTRRLALLCVALSLGGCSPEVKRKAAHSDGAIQFVAALAGHEHQDVAPIRKSGGGLVEVASAHAVRDGEQMRVYGSLQRLPIVSPGPGAHLDVHLVAANGKTLAHAPATYSQTMLERRNRTGIRSRASFSARLPLPPPGAHVEIMHHDETVKKCMSGGCVRIAAEKQS